MKIETQKNKQLFSVLGLPRGGTTIVCNILNSLDNGFCLCEPQWIYLTNPKSITFDKLKNLNCNNADSVFRATRQRLNNDDTFSIGGIKETFRPDDGKMKPYISKMMNKSNVLVFVFREPKALYNSYKLLSKQHNRNFMPMDKFLADYNQLLNAVKNTNKDKIVLGLEKLCNAGNAKSIAYFNERAKDMWRIKGDFVLRKPNFKYGNPQANNSTKIAKANMDMSLLTRDEKKTLNEKLKDEFEAIISS